jgi:hypothetical protein
LLPAGKQVWRIKADISNDLAMGTKGWRNPSINPNLQAASVADCHTKAMAIWRRQVFAFAQNP